MDTGHAVFAVGLTGGIGSGKSLVADLFAAQGATIIDTDRIAHQLTAVDGAAMAAIKVQFGTHFLTPAGAMDRNKMRQTIFADLSAKHRLESILHPLIRAETERALAQVHATYPLVVIPLLVESGTWKQRLSRVLAVDSPEALQIARVMQRSKLTQVQVAAIMAAQVPRSARLAAADDVIVNAGQVSALEPQVQRLHALYCSLAAADKIKSVQHL